MSKIGLTLRDGTRLLQIFQTVATAEYFRGPRNSITTALHYGKCQWVFKVPLRRKFVGLFRPNSVAEYRVVSIFIKKTEQETVHPNIF